MAGRALSCPAAVDTGLAELDAAGLSQFGEARLGLGEELARGRRLGGEMDMDAIAVLTDRDVDLAQRLGRQAEARFARRRGIAHRLEPVDHLPHPFLAAHVEHALLDVGGSGDRVRADDIGERDRTAGRQQILDQRAARLGRRGAGSSGGEERGRELGC